VDSRKKNFNVTKKIVKTVTGRNPESYSILKSLKHYQSALQESTNWRDFYERYFKMSKGETDNAGSRWTEFQLQDSTPVLVFESIPQLLEEFKNGNHAIISQNSRDLIQKILDENNIHDYFNFIIGYEEVGIRHQKPDPEGLITSMERIEKPISGTFIYIGDHETDVQFASNANRFLKKNALSAKVISIAAHYQSETDQHPWTYLPDFQADSVSELGDILRKAILG